MKIKSFKKVVTTATTRVALKSSAFAPKKAALKAPASNTGIIYVGGDDVSAANGYPLAAGESLSLDPNDVRGTETSIDLESTYIDASVSGEGVVVLYGYEADNEPV